MQIAAIAADLICWLQLLALHDQPALARAEPKLLRFRMLHVPAQSPAVARRHRLRIPKTWPWAAAITTAFARIAAIPAPT